MQRYRLRAVVRRRRLSPLYPTCWPGRQPPRRTHQPENEVMFLILSIPIRYSRLLRRHKMRIKGSYIFRIPTILTCLLYYGYLKTFEMATGFRDICNWGTYDEQQQAVNARTNRTSMLSTTQSWISMPTADYGLNTTLGWLLPFTVF